jgi:hypothetical protein
MELQKRQAKSGKNSFSGLATAASTFTDKTKITETILDPLGGEWRLGFDNGYALTLCADW